MSANTDVGVPLQREGEQFRFPPRPSNVQFPALDENNLDPLVNRQMASDTWTLLWGFRFINILCVATFFQPDEYYQFLEPAWQMAFGPSSGAWVTWAGKSCLKLLQYLTKHRNGFTSSDLHFPPPF
jgi:hypothetical protein